MCDLKVGDEVVIHPNGLKNGNAAFKVGSVKRILVEVEYKHLQKDGWFGTDKGLVTVSEPFVHKAHRCGLTFDLNGQILTCDLVQNHMLSPTAPNKHHAVDGKTEVHWV